MSSSSHISKMFCAMWGTLKNIWMIRDLCCPWPSIHETVQQWPPIRIFQRPFSPLTRHFLCNVLEHSKQSPRNTMNGQTHDFVPQASMLSQPWLCPSFYKTTTCMTASCITMYSARVSRDTNPLPHRAMLRAADEFSHTAAWYTQMEQNWANHTTGSYWKKDDLYLHQAFRENTTGVYIHSNMSTAALKETSSPPTKQWQTAIY